ncbi:MAG: acyl-CoA desaturase [Propionibacteriales bacterium]|nr:acyl-CoA desaturase [Propionibacteriales bacterium]
MTETMTRPPRRTSHLSDFTALTARIKSEGLLRRSYGYYWTMLIGLPLVLVGLGAVSVWLGDSWWQLAVAVGVAVVMAQFGFLGHDAAHRQIFVSGKWNERVAMILANLFVGLGIGWWQNKHSRHHAAPNKIGADPDIKTDVLVFTPQGLEERTSAVSRWMTGKQGWFFFPLLLLAGLQLHVNSFKHLFARGKVKNRALELTLLVVRHGGLITFAFLVMPPAIALSFLAVQLLAFGFYLGMAFAPNHIGRPIVPAGVKIDFLRRQVLMSRNISGGAGVSILLGGLNYQIEHHLFPSMSRTNLARTAPIVKEYCRKLEVEYHETSLPRAYVEVGRYINAVGRGGVDLWTCPLAASMGRG